MKFETDIFSDRGGKPENEDSAAFSESKAIAVLADGVGAHGGGDIASQLVVKELTLADTDRTDIEALYDRVNKAVLAEQKSGLYMKSTAVMVEFFEESGKISARISNVGDSRCYVFRKGKIIFQTFDHSIPGLDVLRGKIKPQEIRSHPARNRLLRAVGSDNCTPETSVIEASPGDVFLLASDGFWEYVYEPEMEKTLHKIRKFSDWIPAMIKIMTKRFPPDHDNLSAVAVKILA